MACSRACSHYKNGNICEPDFSPFERRERRYSKALHQAGATKNSEIISRKDDYSLVTTRPNYRIYMEENESMKTYKKAFMEVCKTEAIVCNMCGININQEGFGIFEDHISIEKCWGYASRYDGEQHYIDLCQSCYDRIISSFKIKPIK